MLHNILVGAWQVMSVWTERRLLMAYKRRRYGDMFIFISYVSFIIFVHVRCLTSLDIIDSNFYLMHMHLA